MPDRLRDGGRGRPRTKPSNKPQRFSDQGFDATPEGEVPYEENGATEGDASKPLKKGQPKNIQETKLWKEGTSGARRFWGNYLTMLSQAFKRQNRRGQEELIMRVSQIVSVGTAVITLSAWYWFLPQMVRVVALPAVLFGSWWLGTKVVGPSMITRFESHLNPPD